MGQRVLGDLFRNWVVGHHLRMRLLRLTTVFVIHVRADAVIAPLLVHHRSGVAVHQLCQQHEDIPVQPQPRDKVSSNVRDVSVDSLRLIDREDARTFR